jgi:hypothetical protein
MRRAQGALPKLVNNDGPNRFRPEENINVQYQGISLLNLPACGISGRPKPLADGNLPKEPSDENSNNGQLLKIMAYWAFQPIGEISLARANRWAAKQARFALREVGSGSEFNL